MDTVLPHRVPVDAGPGKGPGSLVGVVTEDGKIRALLLENIHPDGVSRLESAGYLVESVGRALDEDELIDRLEGVTLLGIRSKTRVTARALSAAPHLVAIGAFCIGTDQIDLPAASNAG